MQGQVWINTIAITVNLLIAGLALYFGLKKSRRTAEREWGELIFKVRYMWDTFFASAVSKGIAKGILAMNSPVRLIGNTAGLLDSLKERLQAFRRDECPDCDEKELAMRIGQKFKEEIIACFAPNDIQFELGIIIASAVAKGEHTLTEILDEYQVAPEKSEQKKEAKE